VVALALCFLTAISYSELAKIYPEAGFASVTYFAEKAFLDTQGLKRGTPTSMARFSKVVTGWAAHLFYWVYPGVMVAMMANLIGYLGIIYLTNETRFYGFIHRLSRLIKSIVPITIAQITEVKNAHL
jgi:amino acid transporter